MSQNKKALTIRPAHSLEPRSLTRSRHELSPRAKFGVVLTGATMLAGAGAMSSARENAQPSLVTPEQQASSRYAMAELEAKRTSASDHMANVGHVTEEGATLDIGERYLKDEKAPKFAYTVQPGDTAGGIAFDIQYKPDASGVAHEYTHNDEVAIIQSQYNENGNLQAGSTIYVPGPVEHPSNQPR